MNELVIAVKVSSVGFLLGLFYFASLAWSTRKGLAAVNPALWFFASWFVRSAIVMAAFYFVAEGRWQRLLICMAGFIVARILVIRLMRSSGKPNSPTLEASHETQP